LFSACIYAYKNNFVCICMCSSCKIITNLFIILNYLFALYIKLFGDVDSFIRGIHFSLFILYNQIFMMFNVFFVVYYFYASCLTFLFVENNHLFMLLKYYS
jgi:hypothetical protein